MVRKYRKEWIVGVALCVAVFTSSCVGGTVHEHPAAKPAEVKEIVQRLVDESTAALGGTWIVQAGPRLGTCVNERGEGEGVRYTYIKRREQHGDTELDIGTLEKLWADEGLATERFADGLGVTLGVNGRGDALQVISLYSMPHADAVRGTSWCAAGDFVEMRERGET